MSKISITPNAAGTGTFTIASPATNTDRTLTLPDAGGSVVLNEGSGTFKIDSSGNVGINTVSPTAPLHVNGRVRVDGGSNDLDIYHNGSVAYLETTGGSATPIAFANNGTERLRLDASGNLGLGVVPSAWGSVFNVIQVGSGASFGGSILTSQALMLGNTYNAVTGGLKYIDSAEASYYQQYQGVHSWYNAPSGTAGDPVTFTQAMTLDSSGNLGLGTTSPVYKLDINSSSGVRIAGGGSDTYIIPEYYGSGVSSILTGSGPTKALAFGVNGAERMRLKSDGNASIGTSITTSSRLVVGRNGAGSYNTAQLELFSDNGDVVLGFHSAGASATVIDHVRSGNGVRIVALDRTVYAPIAALAFNVNSDYRIKENIIPLTGAADRLMQLPVHRFSFVEGSMSYQDGVTVDGFLAHEVQSVVSEAVTGDKDAVDADGKPILQSLDQSKLVPLLTAALQEALADIATLKAEVAALKGASV